MEEQTRTILNSDIRRDLKIVNILNLINENNIDNFINLDIDDEIYLNLFNYFVNAESIDYYGIDVNFIELKRKLRIQRKLISKFYLINNHHKYNPEFLDKLKLFLGNLKLFLNQRNNSYYFLPYKEIPIPEDLLNLPEYVQDLLDKKIISNGFKLITNPKCIELIRNNLSFSSAILISCFPDVLKQDISKIENQYRSIKIYNKSLKSVSKILSESLIELYNLVGFNIVIYQICKVVNIKSALENPEFKNDYLLFTGNKIHIPLDFNILESCYMDIGCLNNIKPDKELLENLLDKIDYTEPTTYKIYNVFEKFNLGKKLIEKLYVNHIFDNELDDINIITFFKGNIFNHSGILKNLIRIISEKDIKYFHNLLEKSRNIGIAYIMYSDIYTTNDLYSYIRSNINNILNENIYCREDALRLNEAITNTRNRDNRILIMDNIILLTRFLTSDEIEKSSRKIKAREIKHYYTRNVKSAHNGLGR